MKYGKRETECEDRRELFVREWQEKWEGWRLKFGTTKCRTTDISEFQNCEY